MCFLFKIWNYINIEWQVFTCLLRIIPVTVGDTKDMMLSIVFSMPNMVPEILYKFFLSLYAFKKNIDDQYHLKNCLYYMLY